MYYSDKVPFETLLGKTLQRIDRESDSRLIFVVDESESYIMYHDQDCCESVDIESIVGDLEDLIGTPILLAEEAQSDTKPDDVVEPEYGYDSVTWTFYKLATIKGYVDIRWIGESNGYYSESVDFAKV